jgi:hypothetical protein
MTRNRLPQISDERLDQLGRAVVRAHAEAGREAADAAVASPFLYARVRAGVAERQRLAEADGGWLALLVVARRAVPTMAFAAFAASVMLLWFAWFGASTNGQFNNNEVAGFVTDEVVFGAGGGGVESAVLGGGDAPSHDEILRMVVGRGEREAQGR